MTRLYFNGCLISIGLWLCLLPTLLLGAESSRRPNILFAISDDQSYPHASAYGSRMVQTPAFDRVASSGTLFHNAFTASPGCSPSRAAILTGRFPWQLQHAGTHASSFSNEYAVYPDLLEQSGYLVGFTGKGWGPGNWKVGGFDRNPAGPQYSASMPENDSRPQGASKNNYAGAFEKFLDETPDDQPFCFWYGGYEPHRGFEKGSGLKSGKRLEEAEVPGFLPDTEEIRSDLLDYALEIEWFDSHLEQMLNTLEARGLLENTLVVVTSDNGMAFPRAKANAYEHGVHMPLAIAWPARFPQGRQSQALVSLTDLAPTFLNLAGVELPTTHPMSGRDLSPILSGSYPSEESEKANWDQVFFGRERHSSSRYDNLAYPQRGLRTHDFLYIRNFRPDRWPAGAPQKLNASGEPGPMHGGYHDIDACPSLDFLIENRSHPDWSRYFHLAVDRRPWEEVFEVETDPFNLNNLTQDQRHVQAIRKLRKGLKSKLEETGDPRQVDPDSGDIFETYPRYSPLRSFPKPSAQMEPKRRVRDWGIDLPGEPGFSNAITDVPGVWVGHSTIISGSGDLEIGKGPIRTGVTAILPTGREYRPVFAAMGALNGNGEFTGSHWVEESGFLEEPILWTNTHSVGTVSESSIAWRAFADYHGEEPGSYSWASLPVVGETWDGRLNDIHGFHVRQKHVFEALNNARPGPVEEGNTGGGTGMVCFRFKSGIGTASRVVSYEDTESPTHFTVGAIVQANFGRREEWMISGKAIGIALSDQLQPEMNSIEPASFRASTEHEGNSILVTIATDAPLLPHQLKRLVKRIPLGISKVGGIGHNSSGDLFIAFSTQPVDKTKNSIIQQTQALTNDAIDPLFEAVVQSVEESILNALFAAETMSGINGNTIYGAPLERIRELLGVER